ncbi:unnamed protein product [Orchesella dallaii]|uniref:Uncharacterized protein n=1 Tax=Orchesella dallaii TaxID=48710 RepID=A0ABP1Q5Z6_9HEXA
MKNTILFLLVLLSFITFTSELEFLEGELVKNLVAHAEEIEMAGDSKDIIGLRLTDNKRPIFYEIPTKPIKYPMISNDPPIEDDYLKKLKAELELLFTKLAMEARIENGGPKADQVFAKHDSSEIVPFVDDNGDITSD